MRPTLLVLAAGLGSRFGGLKQIEPVGPHGERIIDYSVYDAAKAGFGRIVFVIRKEMEAALSSLRKRYADVLDTCYVFQSLSDLPRSGMALAERQKPLGTGHAVFAARHEIAEPFAVINADDFYGSAAFEQLFGFLSRPSGGDAPEQYSLVGYELANTLSEHGTVSRGVCRVDGSGFLASVEEHADISVSGKGGLISGKNSSGESVTLEPGTMVSLNCWGFPRSFLDRLVPLLDRFVNENEDNPKAEFHLPFAVDAIVRAGQAKTIVLPCSSRWLGVTHRADLAPVKAAIASLVEQGSYTSPLWT